MKIKCSCFFNKIWRWTARRSKPSSDQNPWFLYGRWLRAYWYREW